VVDMGKEYVPASAGVAAYVDRIWSWQGAPEQLPTLLPGTGAELVIHHGSPLVVHTSDGRRPLPARHLLCLRRSRWTLSASGTVRFTAVRFRAGALARFTAVPINEIVDEVVAVADVFGGAADALLRDVRPDRPLVQRAASIEGILVRALRRVSDPRVTAAVRQVYRDPATARVDLLGPQLGLSTRHLRRGFTATVGVAPKEFQQLARFQRVARNLLLSAPTDHASFALAAGYYDQSHYIKEFQRLAGQRPTQLLRRPVSHFYYPSIDAARHASRHDSDLRDFERQTGVRR
jgi:methylphosphotriester-DNA--protein-cysteine methyltransferase